MIFDLVQKYALVAFIILAGASWTQAGCFTRDIETSSGEFQTYYVCENSLSSPDYLISSYMGSQVGFGIMSFDKKGAGYLCHEYETVSYSESKCTRGGIKGLSTIYKNNNSKVYLLDISTPDGIRKGKGIFNKETRYSTAESFEEAEIQSCFVRVIGNEVFFGYEEKSFHLFSNCLINFENHLSRNKNLLFDLM